MISIFYLIMRYPKLFYEYIKFNKKNFKNKYPKNKKNDQVVLVELFDIKASIISLSLFANSFKKEKNYKLVGYSPNFLTIKNKIKLYFNWYLNFFSSMMFFKSFGVHSFIIPNKKNNYKKLNKIYSQIIKQIKSKKDVLNIRIEGVHLGDLIYDTYLRENDLITIDINDRAFKNFILKTLNLYFFWKNYFKKNKIRSILASHSVYLAALPMRVAMKLNIEAFCVNHHFVYRLTTKKPLVWGNFDEYPKIFKKLPSRIKKRGLLIAKAQLQNRFIGKEDILYQLSSPMKGKTFSKKKNLKKGF